jgi:hypothetical protein
MLGNLKIIIKIYLYCSNINIMGSSSSQVTDEQINDVITTAVINNTQNCKGLVEQVQDVTFGEVGGNFTLSEISFIQDATLNATCAGESNTADNIKTSVEQGLQQFVSSRTGFFSTGSSNSQANNTLINKISNQFTTNNIQNCLSEIAQIQDVSAEIVKGNVDITKTSFDQSAQVVTNCMANNKVVSESSNQLVSNINQSSSASSEGPLNTLTSMFNSFLAFLDGLLAPLGIASGTVGLNSLSSCCFCCCIICLILLVPIVAGIYLVKKG